MMKPKTMIFGSLVVLGAAWWIASSKGYPDRSYLPVSEPYGVHFVKMSLGEKPNAIFVPDYPEFCVLPPYFRTKDGKGTDNDRKMTFAHCNAMNCLASIEPRFPEYRGKRYAINTPRRKGGIVGFCVTDVDHIMIEVLNGSGLLLDHSGRAIILHDSN